MCMYDVCECACMYLPEKISEGLALRCTSLEPLYKYTVSKKMEGNAPPPPLKSIGGLVPPLLCPCMCMCVCVVHVHHSNRNV